MYFPYLMQPEMCSTVVHLYLLYLSCLGANSQSSRNVKSDPTGRPQTLCESSLMGPRGFPGPIGQTGMPGVPGPGGLSGPSGRTGEPGPVGPRGIPGDIGMKGAKGMQGIAGPNGASGMRGKAGPKGEKGQTGRLVVQELTGPSGPPGRTGETGPVGPRGIPGIKGTQGVAGPKGTSGIRGREGLKGEKGQTGLQGAPGLVPRWEINELKELVSNLSQELQSLRKEIVVLNNTETKWIYINDSKEIELSKGRRLQTSFSISDYGYDSSTYKFREVEVNAEADGDLNASNEYLLTYFNSNQIGGQWPQERNKNFRRARDQLDTYPIQKVVEASSFTMTVYASSSVGRGSIEFTLVRFSVMKN